MEAEDALIQFFEGEEPTNPLEPSVLVTKVKGQAAVQMLRLGLLAEGQRWDYSNADAIEYRSRNGRALETRQRINHENGLVPLREGDNLVGMNVYTRPLAD